MPITSYLHRIAAVLLFATGGTAPAAEPAATDDPCNFHASEPLLQRGVYEDHRYTERDNDNATETARLAAGVKLKIVSVGCVDSSGRTYTLTYPAAALPDRTLAQWADVARHELDGLSYLDGAKDSVRDTVAFAGSVAASQASGDKFVRCADDSTPPDGDCTWSTGGRHAIEVRRARGAIEVILEESSSR
jgi:hypothetical protein